MGHERIGFLPKSKSWRDIVQQIAGLYVSDIEVSDIVSQTVTMIRTRMDNLHNDDSVISAFKFLVALSVYSKAANPKEKFASLGIQLPESITPLSLSKSFSSWIAIPDGSLEYKQIARSATIDVIGIWSSRNKSEQLSLFDLGEDPFSVWHKASDGACH